MIGLPEDKIENIIDCRISSVRALVSVVIVTHNRSLELVECLGYLGKQKLKEFEVIVVDNGEEGEKIISKLSYFNLNLQYIKLKNNYGPSVGRNIGTYYAKTNIVCFLDDDALAEPYWTEAHYKAYQNYQIAGLRGRVLPKRDLIYNDLQDHYDLGNLIQESYIELEGNCSFRKDILIEVGGFNSDLFGAEGLELSYRIVNRFENKEKLIYYPEAIIYHDFAVNLCDYLEKCFRHKKMMKLLLQGYPDIYKFTKSYKLIRTSNKEKNSNLFYMLRRKAIFELGQIAIYLSDLFYDFPKTLTSLFY